MKSVSLLAHIVDVMTQLRKSEQSVAKVVLADPSAAVHMTITEMAEAAGVSQPTIVRFTNAIGCEGFHDFRIKLAQSAVLGVPATQSVISGQDDVSTTLGKVFDYTITTLDHVRRHLDVHAVERVVAEFLNAKAIIFLGLGASGIVAADAEQKFPLFGVPCTAPIDTHQQLLAVSTYPTSSVVVVISNTGKTASLLDNVALAKERGLTVVAITGSTNMLAEMADAALIVEALDNTDVYTPTISRLAQLTVVDALATMTLLQRGEDALEDVRVMKERLALMRRGETPHLSGGRVP